METITTVNPDIMKFPQLNERACGACLEVRIEGGGTYDKRGRLICDDCLAADFVECSACEEYVEADEIDVDTKMCEACVNAHTILVSAQQVRAVLWAFGKAYNGEADLERMTQHTADYIARHGANELMFAVTPGEMAA